MHTRSPVSLGYGWDKNASLDSKLEATPFSSDWLSRCPPSFVYILEVPEYVQVTTAGAPVVVHLSVNIGSVVLVILPVGVTAITIICITQRVYALITYTVEWEIFEGWCMQIGDLQIYVWQTHALTPLVHIQTCLFHNLIFTVLLLNYLQNWTPQKFPTIR